MKTTTKITLGLLFASILLVVGLSAQTVDSVTPVNYTSIVDSVLQVVADALVGKYGWAAKVVGLLGTVVAVCRVTIKPLWAFVLPKLEDYVQSTATPDDDAKLHAFLSNRWVKMGLFMLDIVASVKVPTVKTPKPAPGD